MQWSCWSSMIANISTGFLSLCLSIIWKSGSKTDILSVMRCVFRLASHSTMKTLSKIKSCVLFLFQSWTQWSDRGVQDRAGCGGSWKGPLEWNASLSTQAHHPLACTLWGERLEIRAESREQMSLAHKKSVSLSCCFYAMHNLNIWICRIY